MVRVGKGPNGYVCKCGRGGLRLWVKDRPSGKTLHLESHLPPGVTDPQAFCAHSHEEVNDGDETPLLVYEGTVTRDREQICKYGLGREDEEIVPLAQYTAPRIPMGILGASFGSEDRKERLNGHAHR